MIKSLFKILAVAVLLLVLWRIELILYGLSQARGQLQVIWNARDIPQVLSDPEIPDSVKFKLQLIQEIKAYAEDSLGFHRSKNYSTYYDEGGTPTLWVVTAAKPLAMEPKEWSFPFLGRVPYKGFFVYEKALREEERLIDEWDTNLRVAGGWSTLGWFRDPVLSNMLTESEGGLSNTIIHELTHGNLFVKDSVAFNENLASFIGHQGALRFLSMRFGRGSIPYQRYLREHDDRTAFTEHILRGADRLDSLYGSQPETLPLQIRITSKKELINEIILTADTLTLYEKERYVLYLKKSKVNNAFFMSYLRYRGDFTFFEKELNDKFKGNLRDYFSHLRLLYPSL